MSKVISKIKQWLRKMQIENPFLYRGSQIIFRFLLEQLCPGFGLFRIGLASLLSCLLWASKNWGFGNNMPGLIKAVTPSSTGMGDMPIVRAPSRIGFVTGESSSVPQVIEVDEVPQEEIWSALEERGGVVPNIARNRSLESSLRQRLNAFGNEESPLLLGKKRGDYWEEVQSSLGAASTQREYNNLLSFENRDLEIRELKNQCMSLFREELDQHPDLLPKCLALNPR